jgi:hypothetical protein
VASPKELSQRGDKWVHSTGVYWPSYVPHLALTSTGYWLAGNLFQMNKPKVFMTGRGRGTGDRAKQSAIFINQWVSLLVWPLNEKLETMWRMLWSELKSHWPASFSHHQESEKRPASEKKWVFCYQGGSGQNLSHTMSLFSKPPTDFPFQTKSQRPDGDPQAPR